ncbi:MAG TPA: protease modulator HflC [Gammaproteobacteria bacterium]|nr:protease modulator HflC [Gammaproteobacteria bacterium]
MRILNSILLVLVALIVLVGATSVFVVSERDLAIRFRFGEIVQADYEPGLHFKVPFINTVRKFDRRILTLDNRPEEFLTAEKKNVIVDFFVKWRISDVTSFYRATGGGQEVVAEQRLLEIMKDGLRAEFARRTVQEVVSAERAEIMRIMANASREAAREFGITVVDVRVKRIDLPDEVSNSVYERMTQERARVAAQLRAEGAEAAERIRAEADRERTVILANAYRDAEIIRGQGDARAAEIYAEAYNRDPQFYAFHRSLEAYRRAMGEQDVFVIDPDSEFFRFFGNQLGRQ